MLQSGDTVLIGAVRGGHVEIVRALLHKYADIDIRGQVSVMSEDRWEQAFGTSEDR